MPQIDVFGTAIEDYYKGNKSATIIVHSEGFDQQEIRCKQLFRSFRQLPNLEKEALRLARGKILDIGAGAGCHSLILQQKGADVTALEISAKAVEVMSQRGISKVKNLDIYKLKGEKYDTLLLLMNGLGLAGTIMGLGKFLQHLKTLLKPGGIILAESSDLLYFAEDEEIDEALNADHYYGEVKYKLEYKGETGKPFKWLFVDIDSLKNIALKNGFEMELLFQDFEGGYLVKLFVDDLTANQKP
jgi:SAM-dependent methyltransferase